MFIHEDEEDSSFLMLIPYMRLLFLHIFLGLSSWLLAQTSAHFGAPKFAPADGKKLLILGQDLSSVGGLASHSDGYIDHITEHFPAGVTTYTDIPNLGGLTFQQNWGAGDVHASAYVEEVSFDNTAIVIGLYIVNRLNGIKDGFFNSSIRKLALWCKEQYRPIFIRIGYEFEGPWNNYGSSNYKEAWRQIVHIFDEEEVQNVAYVWQSAGLNYNNIENWYPGDDYVNWVGYSHFDGFNMGQSIRDFAAAHNKPIMIAEATPRRQIKSGSPEGHWRSWYTPLFTSIYDNDQIKALAYINANWETQTMWRGQGWGDSRVEAVEEIRTLWVNEIAKEPWLTASDTLFQHLQLDTWLTTIATSTTEIDFQEQFTLRKDSEFLSIQTKTKDLLEGVQVWDLSGKLLVQYSNSSFQYQIPISHLRQGMIAISVKQNGKWFIKKEVVTGY